ncbi:MULTISPECIES: hypothetical protein [Haloferax]|nr:MULTISPECIES: hypothetical protein [Haloferax]
MQGDESGVVDTSLRIELCPDTGEIRVHRTTELGTYTRTIDR